MEIRWASSADFALLPSLNRSSRGLVLVCDGRPAALATIFYEGPNSAPVAAIDFFAPVRPLTLHRFGKAAIAAAVGLGVRRFMALADCNVSRSDAWLERLGLRCIGRNEKGGVYLHE